MISLQFFRLSQAFAQICKYAFAVFHKLSQFMVSQSFTRIRKDLQMDFRNDSQVRKSWFFARICHGHFADDKNQVSASTLQVSAKNVS